jgi:hypothetical protein
MHLKDIRMKSNKPRLMAVMALTGLSLTSPTQAAADPNFYVFLAFGQSNMEGVAPAESQDQAANSRYKVLSPVTCSGQSDGKSVSRTQGQWSPAVAPIVRCDTHLSILDWFGRTLTDSLPANITIGVVPVAVGGTAITGFIESDAVAYYKSQATWMQQFAANYGGNPYTRLVATAKTAQNTGVIKGIIFHQGETDGSQSGWGDKVKTIYNRLLTDLNLKAAEVPFLAGEVYNNTYTNKAINALPSLIPTAHAITSQGLTIGTYANNQGVHFSAASYRDFGKRYAAQMLKLLPRAPSDILTKSVAIASNADFVVYDIKGSRVDGFHATDAASLETSVSGLRKSLPEGIYWVRNTANGSSQKIIAGH